MARIPLARRLSALGVSPTPRPPRSGTAPRKLQPLEQRVSALKTRDMEAYFSLPFASFFQGLGMLAGTAEAEEKAGELRSRFRIPPEMNFSGAVRYALRLLGFPEWEQDGNLLLYALLIEPFAKLGCLPTDGHLIPPLGGSEWIPEDFDIE